MQAFLSPQSDHCLVHHTEGCLECVMVSAMEMSTVPSPIIEGSWKLGIWNVQLKEGVSFHV